MMRIFREFRFEAAHRLPNVPEGHKCSRLHGHSYSVEVHVTGPIASDTGWIVDFGCVDAAFDPIRKRLDHSFLNDLIPNPTSEHLAAWIWGELATSVRGLCRIVVRETERSGCVYEGPATRSAESRLAAAISLLHEVHDRGAQSMDTHARIGAFLGGA